MPPCPRTACNAYGPSLYPWRLSTRASPVESCAMIGDADQRDQTAKDRTGDGSAWTARACRPGASVARPILRSLVALVGVPYHGATLHGGRAGGQPPGI